MVPYQESAQCGRYGTKGRGRRSLIRHSFIYHYTLHHYKVQVSTVIGEWVGNKKSVIGLFGVMLERVPNLEISISESTKRV